MSSSSVHEDCEPRFGATLESSNTLSITRRENRNHMRVLIVEDEPGIRQTMLRVFEREGHVVDEAADGQSGLSKAVTGEHDVVILDVLLPILDGLQVCKAIRAAGVKTPVLMLTALSDVDDRVNGLDSGADDYLGKPFAFKELLARVRALGRRGGENVEDTTLR
jgi:DNA-binding response OmpR family regulator